MTLKVELPADVAAGLLSGANERGLSPEAFATELLRERLRTTADHVKRSIGRKSLPQLFADSPLKGLDLVFDRDADTCRPVDL